MQAPPEAFRLPDFYVPHPARLNPHLERAAAHSPAWAKSMGMLDAQREGGGVVWDEATNPAEAGLQDLWARTIPRMSPGWRQRFTESLHNLMVESMMWELGNIELGRVANPVEYVQMRLRGPSRTVLHRPTGRGTSGAGPRRVAATVPST